jgi:hypothetical protein
MRSPFYFIAKPVGRERYSNTKDIAGIELVVSTSEEDHRFSNRHAEVVEVPSGYSGPIKPGDTLLVHHNVFKFYNDMKGNRKSGKSFFRDDVFLIEPDQFFMFKNENGWNSYSRYNFVRPVPAKHDGLFKGVKYEPLMGQMVYPSEAMVGSGVAPGDIVCFAPECEYEFIVDDEPLYRIYDQHITAKL